jgi:hypothetical protein
MIVNAHAQQKEEKPPGGNPTESAFAAECPFCDRKGRSGRQPDPQEKLPEAMSIQPKAGKKEGERLKQVAGGVERGKWEAISIDLI